MNSAKNDLSIVIPIYNAEKILEENLSRLITGLKSRTSYEILLCNDGSTDRSEEILKSFSNTHPQVKSFSNAQNQGIGYTVRSLFAQASGEVIIYMDIDLPFGTDVITDILRELECCDVVVLSRYSQKNNHLRFIRHVTSQMYYWLCRLLFRVPVRDIGSGTVAVKRNILERIELQCKGFGFHVELLTAAHKAGAVLKELPGHYKDNRKGSFRILKHGPQVIAETFQVWRL